MIAVLLTYVAIKVTRALGRLSQARIAAYTGHLTYLHEMADAVNRGRDLPKRQTAQDKTIDVIASFPVMRASSAAYEALKEYLQVKARGESPARVEAAKQALEAALVELNVKMRDDLKLNSGAGQIPNAEVFRRNRGNPGSDQS